VGRHADLLSTELRHYNLTLRSHLSHPNHWLHNAWPSV
jgi:hypothetical protein